VVVASLASANQQISKLALGHAGAIAEAELLLQHWKIFDNLTVGIALYEYSPDYGWFLRNCNSTYKKQIQKADENLQGLPIRQIFERKEAESVAKSLHYCMDCSIPASRYYDIQADSIMRTLRCDGLPVANNNSDVKQVLITTVDVTNERSVEKQLANKGMMDELTGLQARMYFNDCIEQRTLNSDSSFAVLLVDLDRFQFVNETLGHIAGDELLISAARRLLSCIRQGDTLARLASDEFGILVNNIESIDDAMQISERVHRAMMKPFNISGQEVFVTASIGISVFEKGSENSEDVLRDADFAMHRAKKAGRSCTQVYQSDLHSKAKSLFRLEADLRRAIERDELSLVYQPIVRLADNRVTSFEALMRWNKAGQNIPPVDFIPLAEDSGLIVPMGRWALKTASLQAAQWRAAYGENAQNMRIAINVSAVQLSRDDILSAFRESFEETGLDGSYLTLELTESSLVNNPAQALETLRQLKSLNLQLALDDFGTGYSSLSYLTSFPIDVVKIDRSFITKMLSNDQDYQIVLAILTLARNLGKRVVAEGIELTEHVDELRDMGCDYGQGYLFAKPLSAEEAGKRLLIS
jgi:diguanylate cyclase (GGDEF)-like protein